MTLHDIDDSLLIDSYVKAVEHRLEDDFIALLQEEVLRRGIRLPELVHS
ncbi:MULTISPECIES: sporulation histidine kinase inhibitor Sda [Shouchella]|jgi:hypothetical protein|uniref:Sporulation histidine kinase inhibitor Sda n=2 Tax=Shouchella TaxID=2893057 RepID=A0A268S667_SHOCL|nr:sporulation histidine kinase inhibitor Sda [Shouchella clausii]PAD40862.1 sporulation histidine kinase inhibitor Sda [Bacillus sp. 7520-S]SPT77662.1 Sporulation inhibitor A [Niallia circulans]AST94509.1 hypothetical protein BC8716_00225 [Shouchella clausii]MBU8596898.1 sporulation histidine kinase inhibitor Sda [Shouchella clausii]MCM3548288.1 sporulation histidine kinase inhibitor Sda [Shouchella clausii]